MKGTKTDLASLVLDDTFKAEVTVVGATTYQMKMGGTNNAVELSVDKITKTN